jgi:coronin-1B/1C/6
VAICDVDTPGRMDSVPHLSGHTAPVLDFDFNPFNDQLIATASEDTTIKLWGIPENGLTENITTPLVDMPGHSRKVTLLKFHPSSENILASVAGDFTVKLWDVGRGSEITTLHEHTQLIQDIAWDHNGKEYATSCKDKSVRIIDARTSTVASTIELAHEGAKSMKLSYLGDMHKLVTVGFTKQSQRQFKIWDPRNTSKEVAKVGIDQAAGVLMPFYDPDTCMLYRYYELVNEEPHAFPLNDFRSSVSAKGMAWMPKRGLNVMGCETARLMKLTTNSVEPLSFFVPRKSDSFQEDLYPHTASDKPATTAVQWVSGEDKLPLLMSLDPFLRASESAKKKVFVAAKSATILQMELDAANCRILELEGRLAAAGLSTA